MKELLERIREMLQAFRRPLNASGWVVLTVVITMSVALALDWIVSPSWIRRSAELLLVSISTAFVTRFIGGMGMFRDAIADVLGEDRWLDRRNDLADLWMRISRRIFMPGFTDLTPNSNDFLTAVNQSMNNILMRNQNDRAIYYQKDARREIHIEWKDREKRIVTVKDHCTVEIYPFDPRSGCVHKIEAQPCNEQDVSDIDSVLISVKIDGTEIPLHPRRDNTESGSMVFDVKIPAKKSTILERTIHYNQILDVDPAYFVLGGTSIVWGMSASITWADVGLHVVFEEVGVDKHFNPYGAQSSKRIGRRTWGALLAGQGFVLVILPVQASLAAVIPD